MKELIQFFEKDIRAGGFTRHERILGGVVYPLAFTAAAIAAPAVIEFILSLLIN